MGEVVEIREEEDVIQIISDSEEQSPSKGGGNVGDDLIIISCQGVLLGKGKVPGGLSLLDTHLVFSPRSEDQAASSIRIENASIISMQVSKAGASRPILRVVAAEGGHSFDFSQALNGGMHRDTFKDAIADMIVANRKAAVASGGRPAEGGAGGEAAG
ncbi:hypothetical protein T484DRAFT_1907552, partial [Baffinella frigidus]